MELSTIIGLAGAVAACILTILIEGGSLLSFVNVGSLILILGGSLAVGITSFGLKVALLIPNYIMRCIFPPTTDLTDTIVSFVSFSEKARREGLLSLEDDLKDIPDKMIVLGLGLVIDGNDPELVRNILEDLSDSIKKDESIPAELFETLGGFSPTLGIIGTVMGLVHVLANLGGGGVEELGRGIAVAFIATFYGISFANLIWLPLANKLKHINKRLEERREVIIRGVLGIQSGENPRIVKQRLISQISDSSERDRISNLTRAEE